MSGVGGVHGHGGHHGRGGKHGVPGDDDAKTNVAIVTHAATSMATGGDPEEDDDDPGDPPPVASMRPDTLQIGSVRPSAGQPLPPLSGASTPARSSGQ